MDSTRILQLALGIPDAIAPQRRDDAVVRRLFQRLPPQPHIFLHDTLMPASVYRKKIDQARTLFDGGGVDEYLLAESDHMLDSDYPHPPDQWNLHDLGRYVVRTMVAYTRANPVLDDVPLVVTRSNDNAAELPLNGAPPGTRHVDAHAGLPPTRGERGTRRARNLRPWQVDTCRCPPTGIRGQGGLRPRLVVDSRTRASGGVRVRRMRKVGF